MDSLENILINNRNLIYSIASKFNGDIDDLFQAGCIGMIKAYKNFDENKNTKFTTFSYSYILGEILEYVRKNHTMKISKEMLSMKNKIEKVKSYLTQKLMRNPTIEEISETLNIPVENLIPIINYNECYSLDNELYDVVGEDLDYDTILFIKEEINNLNEPERTIMYQRYFEDKTQSEIANNLNLSQVDVSRKEKKVLTKIRTKLTI